MGFNKIAAKSSNGGKEFKPTTPRELKEIARRAREKQRAKKEEKEDDKEERKQKKKLPRGAEAVKLALEQNQKVRTFNPQLFEKFLEHVHMLDLKKPAYRMYVPTKERDATFMYEIQVCLAKMSWQQLGQLIGVGVDAPVPTKSWTDAFHKALNVMISAFDVVDYLQSGKGSDYCKIKDREALDAWPVSVRQRRSGSTNEEEDDMHTDENNRKLRALSSDDDDEDEDESPKGRRASKDDDDDEDEDEKPRGKRASAKSFGKGVGKKKRASRDEDEDEKPRRKAKASKSNGKEDDDEEEDVELNDRSLLVKVKDRDKGGIKTTVLDLVPQRKAATLKDIVAKAKEEGISPTKARKIIETLHGYGYIRVR